MGNGYRGDTAMSEDATEKAVLEERERCAQIAELFKPNLDDPRANQEQLAALIRANG